MVWKLGVVLLSQDDSLQKAIRIGESNKEIIELAHNWCAHLSVEKPAWGGTGIVEVETGLPIGVRYFKCPHASAAGLAGMDLRTVVLDFYDRNCVGCSKRSPVRFPNISKLVGDRDAARVHAEEAARKGAEAEAEALRSRTARRKELSLNSDPPTKGLFSAIGEFDSQPNEQTRRVLLETAVAVPSRFDSQVQDVLLELASAGGFTRTETSLEVLDRVGANRSRLCESALRALARGDGHRIAGGIVAKDLDDAHRPLVSAALPAVISLALPVRGFLPDRGSPGDPRPLETVYRLFPELVKAAVGEHLRDPRKHVRIMACTSIEVIIQFDPKFGLAVAEQLIRSLELPDDGYGEEGSAASWVQDALGRMLLEYPDETDAVIQRETNKADEDVRAALFQIYDRILRSVRRHNKQLKRGHEMAFARMVEVLAQRPDNERLLTLIWFLRDAGKSLPTLVEAQFDELLGAAALLASDLDTPSSPLLDLDVRPNPLKALETATRRQLLGSALDATMGAIGAVAARKPSSLGPSLVQTFEALDDRAGNFKAALVKCLGYVATNAEGVPVSLPVLYQAMTSRLQLVRAAAADAYAKAAEQSSEDLPDLLHENFLLLLTDPYVIVHAAAVDALSEVSLPESFLPAVVARLVILINSYSQSRSDDRLLSQCISRLLELKYPAKNLPEGVRKAILSIIDKMNPSVAADLLRHHAGGLRGTSGLGALLLKLIADADTSEHRIEDLVEELYEIPSQEISKIAGAFLGAAQNCSEIRVETTDDLIEILTAAGQWSAAVDIARDSTARLNDSTWDRPRRLLCSSRETAAEIEAAAAAADVDTVLKLTARWKDIERETKEDDEKNKERRNPLFGLLSPDPSE